MARKGRVNPGGKQLLTRRQLAERFDVHPQTVTKWEQAGLPIAQHGGKGRASLYDEVEVRSWLDAREKKDQANPIDLARERAFKEHWQGVRAQLAAEREAKRLLPAEEVEKAWSAEQAAVRAKLLALPQAFADRVARAVTLHGVAGAERAIREMVDETLTELAAPPAEKKTRKRKRKAA